MSINSILGGLEYYCIQAVLYIEDITRWREDMNLMFECQEQYLIRSLRSLVRYCSCHENIKFIPSSQRVMFLNYMEKPIHQKQKAGEYFVVNEILLTAKYSLCTGLKVYIRLWEHLCDQV